jgi:hypothetical protein
MTTENDGYDTREKIEKTETGFRLSVSSKRGTGTRDQDEVSLTMKTEEAPNEEDIKQMNARVAYMMELRRGHQPDEDDG